MVKVIILNCFANVNCFLSNHFDITIFSRLHLMASSAVYNLYLGMNERIWDWYISPVLLYQPNMSLDLKIKEDFLKVFVFKCTPAPLRAEINFSCHIAYQFPHYVIRHHEAFTVLLISFHRYNSGSRQFWGLEKYIIFLKSEKYIHTITQFNPS